MIMPSDKKGKKILERVPITMAQLPFSQKRQVCKRSLSVSAECHSIIGVSGKRRRKRLTVWGVKPISGTNTKAC